MDSAAVAPVKIGERLLGKYVVERVLGAGGMGCVVSARHTDLDELYAIKLMLPQALFHPEALARFQREARAAAKLKSEHVAKVHDVGRLESGMPYMIMEHLTGRDLNDVLKAEGPLPLPRACGLVMQALEGLAEAHELGIVHRDLKPANLFLTTKKGGVPCVKVLDFGVSKHQVQDGSLDMTKTGMVLGSPLYMSPEQMMAARNIDLRTDIWAMGVTLYQLVTGRVPFAAEVLTELVGRVMTEEPAPPSRHRADVPAGFDAVMARCLAKKPEGRYASAAELSAALAPFAAMAVPQASPSQARAVVPSHTVAMSESGAQRLAPVGLPPARISAPTHAHAMAAGQGATGPFPMGVAPSVSATMGAARPQHTVASLGIGGTTTSSGAASFAVSQVPVLAQSAGAATSPKKGTSGATIAIAAIALLGIVGGGGFAVSRMGAPQAASRPTTAPAEANPSPPTDSTTLMTSAPVEVPVPPTAATPSASSTPAAAPTVEASGRVAAPSTVRAAAMAPAPTAKKPESSKPAATVPAAPPTSTGGKREGIL